MISNLSMFTIVAIDTVTVVFSYGFFLTRMMDPPVRIEVTPILPG